MGSEAKTILLVEDDALTALAEEQTIRRFGYEVVSASSGEEAVRIATRLPAVDLILMDIGLGAGIDGTEAARRILAERELPIVFLTEHTEQEYAERVQQIARYGYITKSSGEFVLRSSLGMAFDLFSAHERLTANETRYSALFQAAQTINSLYEVLLDRDGHPVDYRYLEVNRAFEQLTGQPAAELSGKTLLEVYPRTERWWLELFARVVESGTAASCEEYSAELDRYIELTAYVPAKGLLAITSADVTDRRRLQNGLIQQRTLLNCVIQSFGIPVYAKDVDGRYVIANDAAAAVKGRRGGSLRGQTDRELSPVDIAEEIERIDRLVIESGETHEAEVEEVVDGTRRVFLNRKSPWRDEIGSIIGVVGVAEEVTALKHSQEEAQHTSELLNTLIANMSDALEIVDRRGTVRYVSPNFDRLFGWSTVDRLDQPVWNKVAPADRPRLEEAVKWVNASPTNRSTVEVNLESADRRSRTVEITLVNLSGSGELDAILANLHDLSERKEAERRVEGLLEEKELMLKEVHHRVKNNLNLIASLFSLQANQTSDPNARGAISDATNRLRSLGVLYEQLFGMENQKEMSISGYLPRLVDGLARAFTTAQGIRIEKQIEDFRLPVRQLSNVGMIVNELITNALKHAFTGREEGLIVVAARRRGGRVTVEVSDDGRGLPDGFESTDASGLGITLIRSLSRQLQGSYRFASGGGTRFEMEFTVTE